MSDLTLTDVAGLIERHESALYDLREAVVSTHDQAVSILTDEFQRGGLVAIDLERALVSLAAAGRALDRARREAER